MFDTEQELKLDAFCDLVLSKKQWNIEHIVPEFMVTVADVVAIRKTRTTGVQAKLYRWRDALSQAEIQLCFTLMCITTKRAQAALNGESFLRRASGCVVNEHAPISYKGSQK